MADMTLGKAEKAVRKRLGTVDHHPHCNSRKGKPCDCYARTTAAAHDALDFIMAAVKAAPKEM